MIHFCARRYTARTAAAALTMLFFYAPGSISAPLNYPGSVDAVVSVGAEANCGGPPTVGTPAASTVGAHTASCIVGTAAKASADLPSGEIKAYTSNQGDFSYVNAQAGFVDLVTVTEGFDQDGNAQGTFDLLVDGLFDVSNPGNDNGANFFIAIWKQSDPMPPCIFDADDCGFFGPGGPHGDLGYDYAEVLFDFSQFNDGSPLEASIYSRGTGSGEILSTSASDLRASLSVGWTVTQDNPGYYIAAMGYTSNFGNGTADFYNTASASLAGPAGFEYTSENGFGTAAVPVPAAAWLFGSALLGLVSLSRRNIAS